MVRGAARAHPSASWEEILDLGRVEGPPTVALVLCELGSLELSPAQGEAGGRQGGESEGLRAASWTKALRSSGEQSWVDLLSPQHLIMFKLTNPKPE